MRSVQKNKIHHKNYHVVSSGSHVDSTLFAGFKDQNSARHNSKNVNIDQSIKNKCNHITITAALPPQRKVFDPVRGNVPLILNQGELKRITDEKDEMGKDGGIEQLKKCLEDRQKEIDDMEECKKGWRKLQESKDCREGATDLMCQKQNEENLQKERYCLDKLNREEEVKVMQNLLTSATISEAWNKQVKEKKEATEAWKKEERRMDEEMERARQQKLGIEVREEAFKKVDFMQALVHQINEKKLRKLEEEELKHLEGSKMRQCWARENEEELAKLDSTGRCVTQYKKDLDTCLLDKRFHQLKESEIERRLMKKAVEEKEELEKKGMEMKGDRKIRIQRQQDLSQALRRRQEEALKTASKAEERRIKRAMEQLERDKRNRALIEASMRADAELETKRLRDRQVALKREAEAIQAATDLSFYESDLRMLIREKERDEGMQGQHWKRLEYGALLKQQMCEQERLRKEELCLKYKDRRCYEELEGHRKNLLLKHSEAAISKHKCKVPAPQLLRISEKVKHITENPL